MNLTGQNVDQINSDQYEEGVAAQSTEEYKIDHMQIGKVNLNDIPFHVDESSGAIRRLSVKFPTIRGLMAAAPPPKEGMLGIYSPTFIGLFTNWKPGKATLKDSKFTWFEASSDQDEHLIGSLNFNLYKC